MNRPLSSSFQKRNLSDYSKKQPHSKYELKDEMHLSNNYICGLRQFRKNKIKFVQDPSLDADKE